MAKQYNYHFKFHSVWINVDIIAELLRIYDQHTLHKQVDSNDLTYVMRH